MHRLPVLALMLTMTALAAHAGPASEEYYPLPGRGKLKVQVPEDWQVKYVYTQDASMLPTIHVVPLQGKAFEMTVTVFWHDGMDEDFYSAEALLRRVQQAGDAARNSAGLSNQVLDIQRFEGLRRAGFLYDLHDPQAADADFAYLTQGAFVVGRLVLGFTLLTDERPSKDRDACLDFLRAIRHVYAAHGVSLPWFGVATSREL